MILKKSWKYRGKGVLAAKKTRHSEVNELKKLDIAYGVKQRRNASYEYLGGFGSTTKVIEINGKKYQMWGFDTKSKSSANHYADQLRRTGKDVIVTESKNSESTHGWLIFARNRPGRKRGSTIGSFGGEDGQNGYICFHKGKRYEIYANSTFEAQKRCAEQNKIKKRHEITVVLAEKNGKPVTHTPNF
jgi:hypothetical protein